MAARIAFIKTAGMTATLQASLVPQRRGTSGGGSLAAGRFTGSGFSTPPTPNAGRVIKR